ncbi:MAG: hypothetical protein J6L64_03685 [Opitutales bacterium]|nr:hypothetical protein [Opitutales bacterium]
MKYLKLAVLSSVVAATALFSGCAGHDTIHKGPGVTAEASHNFLGIVKTNPGSYRYVDEAGSIVIRTEDLWCRRDFTGDNVSLLWGLVNINDY